MKRWLETLLGLALVGAWAAVALTASEATRRDAAAAPPQHASVVVAAATSPVGPALDV